LSVVPVIVLY
jgi:hypothetical protein